MLAAVASFYLGATPSAAAVLTSAREIRRIPYEDYSKAIPFCVTGLVTRMSITNFRLDTGHGVLAMWCKNFPIESGQIIRAIGMTTVNKEANLMTLRATNVVVLGTAPLPEPILKTYLEIQQCGEDDRMIRVRGFVNSVFEDEVDKRWSHGILGMDGGNLLFAVPVSHTSFADLKRLVNGEIEMTGVYSLRDGGFRRFSGRHLAIWPERPIRVLAPPPADAFDVPPLGKISWSNAETISGMRQRRIAGRVLASWDGHMMILQDTDDQRITVQLEEPGEPPAAGVILEAVGLPETDFYHLTLSHAVVRPITNETVSIPPEPAACDISVNQFFHHKRTEMIDAARHGQLIRIRGTVRVIPNPDAPPERLILESEGRPVPVALGFPQSGFMPPDVGSEIEVAGICTLETENWSPSRAFPQIRGFTVITRRPSDIRVLTTPPWWTPRRFAIAVVIFIALLVAILIWNASLRVLVERRSRQLIRSQAEKLESDFRLDERTRIASDLHDYLAQNLTALSYQLTAAKFTHGTDPAASARHLATASTMLDSSRTELRRCLWDLKSEALEEPTFDRAIRRAIQQVLDDTALVLDVRIPRSTLSDTTAHALLSVIRELVANAIRHGRAREIRIGGEIESGVLRLSVTDDGRGFDPAVRANSACGHFGLDGARNRIERLGGSFEIDSAPGKGVRARIELHLARHTQHPKENQ